MTVNNRVYTLRDQHILNLLQGHAQKHHEPLVCYTCGKPLSVGDEVYRRQSGCKTIRRHLSCWQKLQH